MAKRKIVEIDEELCDGCGACVPNCPEGAIEIIDGKARLVSDVYCDGLGACLGHCPRGAISIVERDADPFDEKAVLAKLEDRVEDEAKPGERAAMGAAPHGHHHHGAGTKCPGSAVREFTAAELEDVRIPRNPTSALTHWPVQIDLVPSRAPFFDGADLLLAADCVPFAYAGFHRDLLSGRSLLVGCPKLDDFEAYREKITAILEGNEICSLTVVRMEVPCCAGLTELAERAVRDSGRGVPLDEVVVSIRGEILERNAPVSPEEVCIDVKQ